MPSPAYLRLGTTVLRVLSPDAETAALVPGLLPEYGCGSGSCSTASHTVRVESEDGGRRHRILVDERLADRCDRADLPATLEFVLARTLLAGGDAHALLHAAALAVGDRALVLVGPSGAGKSSLALQLNRAGHPLLTDDFLLVRAGGTVEGFRRHPKLDVDTLSDLGFDARESLLWSDDAQEAWLDPERLAGWCRAPMPVAWIVLLEGRGRDRGVRPRSASATMERLLAARAPEAVDRSLPALAEMVQGAQKWGLAAPSHSSALAAILGMLERSATPH